MKTFNEFIIKSIYFIFPGLLLTGIYLYEDPFKVLQSYKIYNDTPLFLNEGYIGWQTYLNYRDSLHFDSYIMGNSCTMAFQTQDWEKHLQGGKAVRLFGNAETLGAVYHKIVALDKEGGLIANVLFIFDITLLRKTELATGHMYVLPSTISGISNFNFQFQFLQGFLYPKFLIPYLDYKLFRKYRPYMAGIINPSQSYRNTFTNDIHNPREDEIEEEGDRYWKIHQKEFPERNGQYKESFPVLSHKPVKLLTEIKYILQKHETNYKIIINPTYSQVRLNPKDLEILQKIFGEENVFDFSGINEYTNDLHNYYEQSHYRPQLGRKLLEKIYTTDQLRYCKKEKRPE